MRESHLRRLNVFRFADDSTDLPSAAGHFASYDRHINELTLALRHERINSLPTTAAIDEQLPELDFFVTQFGEMNRETLLFNKVDMYSVCENQKKRLRDDIYAAQEMELFSENEADLINKFATKHDLTVPEIREDRIESSQEPAQIDVSQDRRRAVFDRSRPFYMPGTIYTIHMPFTGEAELFNVQPSSFSLSPPRGRVEGDELQFIYETLPDIPIDIKGDYQRRLGEVKQYLGRLRNSAVQLNDELLHLATLHVQTRKKQIETARRASVDLGLPVRQKKSIRADSLKPPSSQARVAVQKDTRHSRKRWDVFISHASEDKAVIATPLANELKERGLEVWYDEFILKVGDSLRASIDRGLANSKFGIVILSEHFFAKHWPQQELNGLASREVNGRKLILPVWHQINHNRVAEFSPTLADRLGALTDNGLEQVIEDLLLAME